MTHIEVLEDSAVLSSTHDMTLCPQEMTNPVLEDAELEAGIAEQVANAKAILGEPDGCSALN